MHVKKTLLLVLIAYVVATLITGCDNSDPVTSPEVGATLLAPGVVADDTDPLLYATPETGEYHLASCLDARSLERVVMPRSEAIALEYVPCETCFPTPYEPHEERVYVVDGDDRYHLAGCPFLDDTREVIPKAEAIDAGYVACFMCSPEEYVPPPSSVYIIPESLEYHFLLCPELTDDKEVMLKEAALEAGYTPHECATHRIIHGGLLSNFYYCPDYGERYHLYNCPSKTTCKRWFIISEGAIITRGLTPCDRCDPPPVGE